MIIVCISNRIIKKQSWMLVLFVGCAVHPIIGYNIVGAKWQSESFVCTILCGSQPVANLLCLPDRYIHRTQKWRAWSMEDLRIWTFVLSWMYAKVITFFNCATHTFNPVDEGSWRKHFLNRSYVSSFFSSAKSCFSRRVLCFMWNRARNAL